MVPLPPYARRVEYLEVGLSGTFSVITDFTADTGYIEAKLEAYSTNSFNPNGVQWQYGFMKAGTANNDAHRLLLYTSTTYTGSGKRWLLGRGVSSPDARILTSFPGVLNITKRWFNTSGREVPDNFRLFGTTADPSDAIPLRLYYFRFYDPTGSTIAAEFIPCRILDKGYVFDTVSGKFYGNSGTGDFVLGPDVREGVVPTRLNPFGVGRRQEWIRRVEYLESTGTQYVDTGLSMASGAFEAGVDFDSSYTGNNCAVGVQGDATSGTTKEKRFAFYHTANGTIYTIDRGTAGSRITGNGYIVDTGKLAFTIILNSAKRIIVCHGNGINGVSDLHGRVRYFKLWDSTDALVRDFVPVAIGSTGYLLDRVSGQLFGNQGTGDFVVGPDIVPVEYVESTGTQYVDTGIVPENGTTYDIRFQRTRTNATEAIFGLSSTSTTAVLQRILGLSTKIEIARGGSGQSKIVNITNDTNWHTVLSSATEIVVDGVSTIRDFSASTAPYSLYVFAQQASAGKANAYAKARISRLQISDGSTLVRDFVPVRVGTEGALYDRVTDTVFRSATSTPLVAGPDKT